MFLAPLPLGFVLALARRTSSSALPRLASASFSVALQRPVAPLSPSPLAPSPLVPRRAGSARSLFILSRHQRQPPLVGGSCLVPTPSSPSPCLPGAPPPAASGRSAPPVRWVSVKRRRVIKMNKHKYEKLKKRMRRLTAKNLKGNAL